MSESIHWHDVRLRAVELFDGQVPPEAVERVIVEVWQRQPAFVEEKIAGAVSDFEAGRIHTPWLALKARIEKDAGPVIDASVAAPTSEKVKAVERARAYAKRVGYHFPSEAELVDELFGDRGMLRFWATDEPLEEEFRELYRTVRPVGLRLDEEAEARGRAWAASRDARLAEKTGAAAMEANPFS